MSGIDLTELADGGIERRLALITSPAVRRVLLGHIEALVAQAERQVALVRNDVGRAWRALDEASLPAEPREPS